MKDKNQSPNNDEFKDTGARKMDGSMRRLLQKSEAEILKLHNHDQKRLTRKKKKIENDFIKLSSTVSEPDIKAAARTMRRRLKELMPHRDLTAIIPDSLNPIRIRAIVHFSGNRDDLEAMGIKVRSQAQDVFTITGTRQQLKDLVKRPSCRRLRTPRIFTPTVEDATARAEITEIHRPRSEHPNGFRGNGVLVAIIDSPLDVTHHGFRDPNEPEHNSRVLYYWAQDTHIQNAEGKTEQQQNPPGETPQEYSNSAPPAESRPNFEGLEYGRLYTNGYINTALRQASPYGNGNNQICCEPRDDTEHGTHVAGIAAGSGHVLDWEAPPWGVGAAPEASIIHVRTNAVSNNIDADAANEDSFLDAIFFCMQAADFHNMPIVINVSQGSNWGPHNGTTQFDQARDNLVNSYQSRSIVWAAGNDNNAKGYRKGTVDSGNGNVDFTLTMGLNEDGTDQVDRPVWLDIWYTGPELDYRVTTFDGSSTGWCMAGQDYSGAVSDRDIEVERDIEQGGDLRGVRIYIDNANSNEIYTIDLRNPHPSRMVNYHSWVGHQGWKADLSGFTQNEATLADTACGKAILTVGSCKKVPNNRPIVEEITNYSGAGPTVDGRIKPEIVATGGQFRLILSAASDQNSGYTEERGTSMAAPLVAGAVALLFEEYNHEPPIGLGIRLNQDSIKALVTQYANRQDLHLDPAQDGYVAEERNRYGFGRLRMIGPIDHMLPPVDNDLWIRTADDDYGEMPYLGDCFWNAPDIRVLEENTGRTTTEIIWGNTYRIKIRIRNLGDQDAIDATVRLKYALPYTAPNTWFHAEDRDNNKLENTIVFVGAMNESWIEFLWRPKTTDLDTPAGTSHFCLLVEVDHLNDPLVYLEPERDGGPAWSLNIKGTNNVALRNLHIQ